MDRSKDSSYWIEKLNMSPHPEGGYFKEVYRPDKWKSIPGYPSDRRVLTTIYYLLEEADFSAFHRIQSPESWFFHKGEPLHIYSFEKDNLFVVNFRIRREDSYRSLLNLISGLLPA